MSCAVNPAPGSETTHPCSAQQVDFNDPACRSQLAPAASEAFYRKECRDNGVNPNNTFLKQLLAGVTVFDFENGYLGERGIVPILSTLQRLPVVELSMRNCEITTEDVGLIQKTFASHDTLRKIDLRGITLTVAAARRLLTLAVQNSRLTEILVDRDTPKYLSIQKQCFNNAELAILASRCLVCGRSVIHSPDQKIESRLLLSLGDELNNMLPSRTGVALHAMLRCILACCEVDGGVLFLCSSECRLQLTKDIVTAMHVVVCECFSEEKSAYPKNPILRRCVEDILKTSVGKLAKTINNNGIHEEEYWRRKFTHNDNDDLDEEDDEDKDTRGRPPDAVMEECSICGAPAVCLPNGGLQAMRRVCKDIAEGSVLRPSALFRLTKLMMQYTDIRPCSKKCVTHLVRFGIYGYGGVLRPLSEKKYPHISLLDIPLTYLPGEDFAILNFSAAYIDELDEEDTTCALTVASAMSDMDGVAIDPYMIFAFGRHLAQLPSHVLGMELRHACEAVQVVGCLPASLSPFDRRKERPLRSHYVSWEKWNEYADVDNIVRVAFSRRRQGVYLVDGPHGNMFDNTRSALWAFRKQRRAVLISMKFSLEWLAFPGGVVPNESPLKRGFLTTFKVVGQTSIDNALYLICQGNFGPRVGNNGFFYIPQGIFNLYVTGDAYVFIDAGAYMTSRGHRRNLYAARILPPKVMELAEQIPLLQGMHHFCVEALNWSTRHRFETTQIVCEALFHLPPPIFFVYRGCDRDVAMTQTELLKTLQKLIFTGNSRSLLLFYLHEVLGMKSVEWVYALMQQLSQYPPLPVLLQKHAESLPAAELERRRTRMQWIPLKAEKVLPVGALAQAPERSRGTKSLPKRGAKAAGGKKSNKELRDAFFNRLKNHWATLREQKESMKGVSGLSQTNRQSIGCYSLRPDTASGFTARSMALESDHIPLSLVGHPWHSIRLTEADGNLTDYVLLFIKDHTCCFNVKNHTITEPLHPILESRFTCNFPFATGFDCVLHSPVNPRTAYFFCGEQWIEWDTYQQTCTGGPFKLHVHQQFSALPQESFRTVDAAVPVPNTPYAFLFSQLMYILFDLEQRRPVGAVRRVGDPPRSEKSLPTFNSALAKLFPYGPMTTLLWSVEKELEYDEKEECGIKRRNSETGEGLVNVEKMGVMLIGRDGCVAIVRNFAPSVSSLASYELHTIPSSAFSRLPPALQQMTTAALHVVCKHVLDAECNRCGVVLNNLHHGGHSAKAITSTLTQKQEDLRDLLFLTRQDGRCSATSLLCEEAVFVQTEESLLDDLPQVIEVDYGYTHPVAFGTLVVVLDTTHLDPRVLRVAPIRAVVESSDDGIVYVKHTYFALTPYVTATCWGDAHAARLWRLRFITRLPVATGVVRLLWYEVVRVLEVIPVDPTVPHQPHHSVQVNIMAPNILCNPRELLNYLAPGAVFASSSRGGWLKKHCILPLLPDGVFCLFFCGKNFLELDLERSVVVSQRTIPLASHPGFAHLPYPFSDGFNAVFYPNLQNPCVVALVHGKEIILWNLRLGSREQHNDPDSFFKGLPWSMDQVEDIAQIWDCPNELFVIRSPYVVRWNIVTLEVVEGPMLLRKCPHLCHPEFDGQPILCVASFPKEPGRFHVFCEDRVASQTVTCGVVSDRVGPIPVRQLDLFSPMTWYMNWGKRRYDSVIQIDFAEERPLLAGVAMRSSEPCDEDWLIEYSDDGMEWKTVGHHLQSSGLSRTMWGLASVEFASHRLWRLTTDATQSHSVRNQPVFYMGIVFFTLPCAPCLQSAHNIALSGTLNGPISALFMKEKIALTFETPTKSVNEHNPTTHHVTVDYGPLKFPNLMGFTCRCVGGGVNAVWSVWCSDDGDRWKRCGLWRSRSLHFKASWKPQGPRQYWRIELQTWERNVMFENFCLFEYVGPSIALENSTPAGDGWDPSILWEKNSAGCKVTPMKFVAHVGAALVFENKQGSVHLVGVRLLSHGKQSTSTTFVVECSSNAVEWRALNVSLLLRNGSAQAVWEDGDYYQFWRLRIVQHTGPSFLTLRDVCFETSKPAMYRVVQSNDVNTECTGSELLYRGDEPKEMVALQAVLPPDSMYIVEKLSPDSAAWEEVAIIQNGDTTHSRTVHQGWVPRGCASSWRLRPVMGTAEEGLVALSPPCSMDMGVRWSSFSGTTLVSSEMGGIPFVGVTTTGFVEVQAPEHLTENKTDTVVLRSIEGQKVATVTWFFNKGTTPRFHQVLLRGRRFVSSIVSTSPSSFSQPKKSAGTVNSSMKVSTRTGASSRGGTTEGAGNSNVEGEAEEEADEEKERGRCVTIVVETSEDGMDYVPIAERPFSQLGNSLSWPTTVNSSYWRIRFKGIRETDKLELRQVTWFLKTGTITAWAPPEPCMVSHSIYSKWRNAAFNYEEEFRQTCREGFDQARSVTSGLREPDDIERHGCLAKSIIRMRARFMNFVVMVSKEAVKDKNPPHNKFISIGQSLSNDIMYLLYRAAIKYDCDVDELNQLVEHPLLLGRDCVRVADNMSWFYPQFVQSGTLVESFYGFHNVHASLIVLWSLSVQLQKNTDILLQSSITPLSPHLASVIIVVNIEQNNWIAAEHFPDLPLLYYAGFAERPMVIVFALNQVTFTSKYNLKILGAAPFPAMFPFKILPGVNFIRHMPLTACPCPLFDCLQMIYSKEFLAKHETEVVFTSPSMHSSTGLVCFTLPGEGVDFAIPGLTIESIEFEVQLEVERDIEEEEEGDVAIMKQTGAGNEFSKVAFVTHNSTFRGAAEDPPIYISLMGAFDPNEDRIAVRGVSPSAHVPVRCHFLDSFITELNVSFDLVAGEAPQSFVEPFFTVAGTLTTPMCGSHDCRFLQVRLHRGYESIALQVVRLQLMKFIQLGDYMVDSFSQTRNIEWLQTIPIACSFNIKMSCSELRAFGSGTIEFLDFRGDASAIITPEGVGITATLPTLLLGDILLQGKSDKDCVVVNIAAPANAPSVIRLDGYCSLLARQPHPTKIEITHAGVMCISTGVLYDVCIEEESIFPSGAYAQVTISQGAITECLSELLQETPMIVAFLATGIPFSLEVEEVIGEECLLERKLLFLTVRGVLFGCRFDVVTSVLFPENSLEEARRICQDLIPRIVEQCDESLWASYEMLAGCLLPLDSPDGVCAAKKEETDVQDEEGGNNSNEEASPLAPSVHPALTRHSLKAKSGQFVGHWITCECEALDQKLWEDFETVDRDDAQRVFVELDNGA